MKIEVAGVWNAPGKSMASNDMVRINEDWLYEPAGLEEPKASTGQGPHASLLSFDQHGMFGDRDFMWVEAEPHANTLYQKGQTAEIGRFLSQREDPQLTKIMASWMMQGVRANFSVSEGLEDLNIDVDEENTEDVIPVSVWGWNGFGVDQGNEAAEWGREAIGRPVRLVRASDQHPRYVEDNPELGRVGFADGFPLLVTSTESVAQVNRWLEEKGKDPVPENRFRANILLDGLEPFQEDYVDRLEVVVDGLVMTLRRAKACGRCPIPDTDQETGERGRSVRSVLGKNRRGLHADVAKYGDGKEIFFGQNFIVKMPENMPEDKTVELFKGDEVKAHVSGETNWQAA